MATASYRDVLMPLAAGAPAQFSLNFSIHVELTVSNTLATGPSLANISEAILSIASLRSASQFSRPGPGGTAAIVRNNIGGPTTTEATVNNNLPWVTSDFNELSENHYEFNGTVSYVVDLFDTPSILAEAPYGAYFLNIGVSAFAFSLGSTTIVDATNTVAFDSITLPDGSPLPSGFAFASESGNKALSTVPIPPAIVLILGGFVCLASRRRNHS